jgi:hypothetical protein
MEKGFPIKMSEMTKMREDGDKVSLYLSYACIGCSALIPIFLGTYFFGTFCHWPVDWTKPIVAVSIITSAVCLFLVYVTRPNFLVHKRRQMEAKSKVSPLEIIFDPSNPARRFWSAITIERDTAWQYRVEIKNNSEKTIKNVTVTTEHVGQMPIPAMDKVFTKTGERSCNLKPGCSELVAILHWPIQKVQPGMLTGEAALEYGPIKITASADNVPPAMKIFDFDYQTDQMLFEEK